MDRYITVIQRIKIIIVIIRQLDRADPRRQLDRARRQLDRAHDQQLLLDVRALVLRVAPDMGEEEVVPTATWPRELGLRVLDEHLYLLRLVARRAHELHDKAEEEEEARQIQLQIEQMAQEAARIERERVAMELDIARREKEE